MLLLELEVLGLDTPEHLVMFLNQAHRICKEERGLDLFGLVDHYMGWPESVLEIQGG